MNLPAAFFTVRCLVWETFRQSLAARTFWLMLGVSALCILFCLGIRVEGGQSLKPPGEIELYGGDNKPLTGPNPKPGQISLGFGACHLRLFRDGQAEIHFLQVLLAKWVGGGVGMLLALIFTAGFLPEFLQSGAAAVLLAKPVPRWSLLSGKYLGVLAVIAFHAAVFFGGTCLAFGLSTGFWLAGYLWCIPLLVLHFGIVYGFSVLVAVMTRSTVASIFGALLLWLLCFGMNYGHHAARAQPYLAPETAPYPRAFTVLVEAGYWVLPKPADLLFLLDQSVQADEHFAALPEFSVLQQAGAFYPVLAVLTSMAFAGFLLLAASREFAAMDY